MHVILAPAPDVVMMYDVDRSGTVHETHRINPRELAAVVGNREADRPRWVWADTHRTYAGLLAAGVRVERCVDLRLTHAILRGNALFSRGSFARENSAWDKPREPARPSLTRVDNLSLFELDSTPAPDDGLAPVAEFRAQQEALASVHETSGPEAASRLGLLLAAESAGALVAAEMTFAGVPWDRNAHDKLLTELLGPRPAAGYRPALLEAKLAQVRGALDAPSLNPDSAPDLLRALQNAGLPVRTTRSWELESQTHPAIAPLLEYKKMSRLMAANGWHWIDSWVRDGRFRPVYVPGGVVTGRWASDGGGALQLPHQVRSAVRADPGWKLIVADAAQLEPRILAAMSGDQAMATAGRGSDLYAGMVASGAVETREQAKLGMLGAMYGGTSGESGRMLPRLTKAFPRAIALVEDAAQTGQRGGRVRTWLGRTSPAPDDAWQQLQRDADGVDAEAENRARGQARSWGRFTRNFIVQGTAAEWALAWMATIRQRLWALEDRTNLLGRPHLAFFLHDEVMIHTPEHLADQVVAVLRDSAAEAGRLLFGASDAASVEFPISVVVVDSYDQAD